MVESSREAAPLNSLWFYPDDPANQPSEVSRWRLSGRPVLWKPPTDLCETNEAYIVRVEIAGVREEDFSVSIQDQLVTIRGIRTEPAEKKAYHQMEIHFGEFQTEVELPGKVRVNQVEAVYQDGFLRVILGKVRLD
jgi:HSP20 family protein